MIKALLIALAFVATPAVARPTDPKVAVEALLAADRAFSAKAAKSANIVSGLAPMIDAEAIVPVPRKGHVVGRDAVIAAWRENPSFKEGNVRWVPVRGGISADGTQGFTYGFLTLTGGDPAKRHRKYLAYWIKRPQGWRVVTYRQAVRAAGAVSQAMLPPSLPLFKAKPVHDPKVIAAQKQSVADAEKCFSDRAQTVGLKAAFREFGRDDAMNMYAGVGFDLGLDAITAQFKDEPTTIHWSTEHSFAASSGDLGVSIGTISPNDTKKGAGFPFFTVWRRDAPGKPWRYIAE